MYNVLLTTPVFVGQPKTKVFWEGCKIAQVWI